MLFCGKIQIRISEYKSGFCVFGGTNPKADHESIKSTFSSDSSDQIQIRIFEIHNLSVFFLGKDLKKVFLTERFFEKKKNSRTQQIPYMYDILTDHLFWWRLIKGAVSRN